MRHLGCRGRGIVPRHPDNALIICFEYSSGFIEDGVIQNAFYHKVAHPTNFHRMSYIPEDVATKTSTA